MPQNDILDDASPMLVARQTSNGANSRQAFTPSLYVPLGNGITQFAVEFTGNTGVSPNDGTPVFFCLTSNPALAQQILNYLISSSGGSVTARDFFPTTSVVSGQVSAFDLPNGKIYALASIMQVLALPANLIALRVTTSRTDITGNITNAQFVAGGNIILDDKKLDDWLNLANTTNKNKVQLGGDNSSKDFPFPLSSQNALIISAKGNDSVNAAETITLTFDIMNPAMISSYV